MTVEVSHTCLAQSAEVLARHNTSELVETVREHKIGDLDEAVGDFEDLAVLRARDAGKLGDLSSSADDARPVWQ